ncbi:MAG: DUF5667 domain-containing protein [Candidatus Doudnabacteria bacterium]|nr:DUF5667 domain-containing protein [bacterium]MDZ4243617.1 DUF5667 domain-containing protein [Candidatus Doudnabacteria bacterium]
MKSNDTDKLIAKFFASLSRKPLSLGDRVAIWMRIQNRIREKRVAAEEKSRGWIFFPSLKFSRAAVAMLIVILALTIVGGAARASKGSLPGQTLYPVKRAVEKVEVAFTTSDEGKVKILSNHAKRRLAEVVTLVQENKSTKVVAETLEDLQLATKQVITAASASKPELLLLDDARVLVEEQEKVLNSFGDQIDQEVKQAVAETIVVSRESLDAANSGGEGTSVEGISASPVSPTSTSPTASGKANSRDGIIQSPIQLHDVSGTPAVNPEPEDPVILPEPTIEF